MLLSIFINDGRMNHRTTDNFFHVEKKNNNSNFETNILKGNDERIIFFRNLSIKRKEGPRRSLVIFIRRKSRKRE